VTVVGPVKLGVAALNDSTTVKSPFIVVVFPDLPIETASAFDVPIDTEPFVGEEPVATPPSITTPPAIVVDPPDAEPPEIVTALAVTVPVMPSDVASPLAIVMVEPNAPKRPVVEPGLIVKPPPIPLATGVSIVDEPVIPMRIESAVTPAKVGLSVVSNGCSAPPPCFF
jgi:hypothetical protein